MTPQIEHQETSRVKVDFLILADRADAVNGKVYIQGGGWDVATANTFPHTLFLSFAIGLLLPWNATNVNHQFSLSIDGPGGRVTDFSVAGTIAAGRVPTSGQGDDQRVLLAVPIVPQTFETPGRYWVTLRVNGEVLKQTAFTLRDGSAP